MYLFHRECNWETEDSFLMDSLVPMLSHGVYNKVAEEPGHKARNTSCNMGPIKWWETVTTLCGK